MSTSPSTLRPILDWTRNPPPPHLTAFQQFTRNVDWKSSPLGPMESWPTQLRQMVLIVMADPSPAVVYWGDGMTIVYNEAYVPLIGQKHPSLQGQDPKIGFAEIWSQFDKIIKDGRQTGQTTVDGRQFLLLQRYGFLEETYFSWKFIPVIGPEGFVIASYATVVEVTREVISDRRMGTIQTLGQHMAAAKSINEVWTRLLTGLEHNEKDIPLALLYSVEKSTCRPQSATMSSSSPQEPPQNLVCVLEGCLGVSAGHLAAPTRIDLQQDSQGFVKAFRDSMRSDGPLLLRKQDGSLSETLLSHIQWRGYGAPSNVVVVCPIRAGPSEILMGFLLLALNPRKSYDSDYQDFVHLITKQITTPHVSAVLLAEEIRQGRSAAKQAAREHAELSKQLIARTLDYEMSEAKFSRFADRVNVGFGIFDLEGQVLYANDVWCGLTSISRANKEPVSWLDGIIPEDQSIVLDIWHTLFVEKSSVKFQARFKKPWKTFSDRSGEMQVYYTVGLCNAYPDLDEDGNVKSIMSCIMDISELKWTEDQVRLRTRELDQSELQYRQFADHAPIGVCLIDPKGCLKFANDAWFEITARSREDNDCMSWLTPIHPDDVSKMEALFADLKVCKGPVTIEMRLKRLWRATGTQSTSKGSPAWILASGYTELNANGTVKNVVCWFTDISAQKAAERDLRTRMDEALEMKRQQENFIDMTSHEIRNPLSAVLHCAEEIIVSLSEYTSKTNSSTTTNAKSLQVLGDCPTVKVKELLEDTIEAAQTIAYCVHHQKRIVDDVLTLSKLDSNLLTISPTPVQPAKVAREALKIFEGELRTAGISMDFLEDLSLRDLGVDWVLLDPSRLLQVLLNLTTNAIKFTRGKPERNITVKVSASHQKPSELGNEIQYFPQREQPQSTAFSPTRTDEETLYLSIAVKDTGRGLSHEEKKLLFNRFSQGSPKTHVKYGGSGLGLFISRQLTEMQGGEIGVASEPEKGSTFVFFVKTRRTLAPRKPSFDKGPPVNVQIGKMIDRSVSARPEVVPNDVQEKQMHSSVKRVRTAPSSLKVLVVEDNLVNQKVLTKQLRNRGFIVDVANHGEEALAALQKTVSWKGTQNAENEADIDVILMDLEMPVMNGLTCVGKIREFEAKGWLRGHVYVIAVTASVRDEHVKAALDAGMDNVTTKPYSIAEILSQIDQACKPL